VDMDQVGLHPPQDAGELQHGAHVLGGAHRLDQVGARDELGTGIFLHVVEDVLVVGPRRDRHDLRAKVLD
jgi:hypothetical protein